MTRGPRTEALESNTLWRQDNILLRIDGSDHHIVTMQVQPNETRFTCTHETPP
jgi:hypothetical protein